MSDSTGPPSTRVDFGHVAEEYEISRGIPEDLMKNLMDNIISTCALNRNTLFLEVGCGAGRFLRELAGRKIPVTGLDISKGMLEKASVNQQSRKFLKSNLIASDAIALPFHQGMFKGILAIHLFHLLADWQEALSEIILALQPDGKLITGWIESKTHGSFLHRLYQQRRAELGYSYTPLGPASPVVLDKLKETGATIETHEFHTTVEVPFQETLSYIERRVFSSMWTNLPAVIHRQIMQDVHEAATSQFKDPSDKEKITLTAELYYAFFG